jgi:hypothetical protein
MLDMTPGQFASWSVFGTFFIGLTWQILVLFLLWRILKELRKFNAK